MYLSRMIRVVTTVGRYSLILVSLAVIILGGCSKPSPTPEPYYEPDYGDLKYIIQGVKDVSMERIGQAQLTLFINRQEGKIEDVMMTVVGLPQGVTATFSPSISMPSFNTTLTIKALRAKEGTYKITVRGSSKTSGFTEKQMNITILPYSNAAVGLEGQFNEGGMCTPSGAVGDTVDVVPVEGVKNRINIKGFWSGVWSNMVYANLNVANKTLDIPSQTVNGVTINGTGTYDDNIMIVGYRIKGFTVDDTCTSTFSRLY